MKKIVGIIAALALAGSVFAGDPDVVPTVLEFKGDASLEWIYDLDADEFGMKNTQNANLKVQLLPETTKSTEGDGLWGELEIKVDKTEINAEKGTAVASDAWLNAPYVNKAVIHFVDDDFYASMDIKGPDLSVGGGDIYIATSSKKGFPSKSATLTGAQGFKINFGLKDLIDLNFSFADDGLDEAKNKDFGFKFDAALKAVENLDLYAGTAYSSEEEKVALAAKASYKLDLGDFYLRPSVGFTLKDKAKNLAGAVMFGWADEGEGADADFAGFTTIPAYDDAAMTTYYTAMVGLSAEEAAAAIAMDKLYMGSGSVPNKVNNGVSVMISSTLEDKAGIDILVGAYDDKLIAGFLPGFAIGAQFFANTETMKDAWVLDAAIKYSNTFDIWTIDANFGLKTLHYADETNTGVLYGFGVSTDNSFIQNTKLYAKYVGEAAKDLGGDNIKGTVTIGTQIHF